MRLTPLQPWIEKKIGCPSGQLTRQALQDYQLDRLRQTLQLVRAKSRFYQQHLAGSPDHLAGLDDLASLPLTSPHDLRSNPLAFLCVSQGDIERVVTLDTSGTSGAPKRIYFTKDDQELTIDFFQVGMSTMVEPGDRVLILLPAQRPGSVGDLLKTALDRSGAPGIKHGLVQNTAAALEMIRLEKPDALVGIPVQLLALARSMPGGAGPIRLKSILLSTDYAPDAIRQVLETAWHCQVYDHYGSTEMGLGGGVQCQARQGYHLREADLFFEIVDPHSGLPLPDGQYGEVVFTTLTRQGMPFIRYRTGDISRFIPGPCPCGSVLKLLEQVRQRHGAAIQLATGAFTIADLDQALFPLPGLLDYSAELTKAFGRDALTLTLYWNGSAPDDPTDRVLEAVTKIECLKLAVEQASLEITAQHPSETSIRPYSGKRILTDNR